MLLAWLPEDVCPGDYVLVTGIIEEISDAGRIGGRPRLRANGMLALGSISNSVDELIKYESCFFL